MTVVYAPVVAGTVSSVLAILLLSLRSGEKGRRLMMALTRRWIGASSGSSAAILAVLFLISMLSFSSIAARDDTSAIASDPVATAMHTASGMADVSIEAQQDIEAFRTYAMGIDHEGAEMEAPSKAVAANLPDVDVMIAKLVARLQSDPSDAKGWKMLGWSYLNTGRADEAAKAYETALKLTPGDADIQSGLEAAASAQRNAPAADGMKR